MKLRTGFLKRNKIDKPLDRLTKEKKTQINKIRNERGDSTTDNTEVLRIIGNYYEQLYTTN